MTQATPTGASTAAAPSTTASTTRDRLLDAAAGLFYREGVGIGVEALCREAGVSKRSMYQLFGSKDEVLAASLERSAPVHQAFLVPGADDRPPRARILHVFERLEQLADRPDFRGCPFVSVSAELKAPDHPASLVARRCKDTLTAFFQEEAERAGVEDPALLARQLTVTFDGSGVRAVMQGRGLDGLAVTMARTLLDAAGVDDA
ncbi:TetR/AcrR family transcriptional regulator [Streptomyces sp. NBC_00340]|uniref:TetR/AcrR family transcriptional regulator n=1 Tax=Streptomyces sp. NBC_00340 TaxID=2975716 RepID=UPI0022535A4B|nr:TetR/AcrR family transcriptional regulator [Streptomyces sp. NBC_00340]MCX5136190.1 TetR/AcrR family transcriptional regulator [Streptomyces sp. NBC_00340]